MSTDLGRFARLSVFSAFVSFFFQMKRPMLKEREIKETAIRVNIYIFFSSFVKYPFISELAGVTR